MQVVRNMGVCCGSKRDMTPKVEMYEGYSWVHISRVVFSKLFPNKTHGKYPYIKSMILKNPKTQRVPVSRKPHF